MSLDGMIARRNGDVSWLHDIPNPDGEDHDYGKFMDTIDTTIMGHTTYQQVLGFDMDFPYHGKKNFVLTRNRNLDRDENVTFISGDIAEFVRTIKAASGKDIWLIGGSQVNTLFMNHAWIDEMWIYVMPVILGPGIPLFQSIEDDRRFHLADFRKYRTGIIKMVYKAGK